MDVDVWMCGDSHNNYDADVGYTRSVIDLGVFTYICTSFSIFHQFKKLNLERLSLRFFSIGKTKPKAHLHALTIYNATGIFPTYFGCPRVFHRNKQHRACPTNGSDCGSLVPRSHNLTLFLTLFVMYFTHAPNIGRCFLL